MITLEQILSGIEVQPKAIQRAAIAQDVWEGKTMLDAFVGIGKMMDPRFVIDSDNRWVIVNLVCWLCNDPRMKAIDPRTGEQCCGRPNRGIYLAGSTGTGKSTTLDVLRVLAKRTGLIRVEGATSGMPWLTTRADDLCSLVARSGVEALEEAKKAPLLCIQDFAAEPAEILYMGNRVNVLRQLLEYRGDRAGITLISSNVPMLGDDIAKRYGDRVISRLQEMCNYLILDGRDRRTY